MDDSPQDPTPQEAMALAQGKKKKKAQPIPLAKFVAAAEPGMPPMPAAPARQSVSWADDAPDHHPVSLPTGPASAAGSVASTAPRGGDRGGDRPRPPVNLADLPREPPFTAYVGNLSFNANESDVRRFFEGCKVTSVRMVMDRETNKPKGFGYVEMADVDSLARALDYNGRALDGRQIRIDIAQPGPNRREDRTGGSNNWRSEGRDGGDRDFDRDRGMRDRPGMDPARSDTGEWRRAEPLAPQPRQYEDRGPRGGFGDRDREDRGPRGGYGDREDRGPRGGFGDRDREDRGPRGGYGDREDRAPRPPREPREPRESQAPAERKKLELKPRTVEAPPAALTDELAEDYKAKPKANPFGAAKPRDENEALRRIEEERKKREEEKRQKEATAKAARAAAAKDAPEAEATTGDAAAGDKAKAPAAQRGSSGAPGGTQSEERDWHAAKSDKPTPRAFSDKPRERREGGDRDRPPRREHDNSRPARAMPQAQEVAEPPKVVNQFELLSTDE